MGEQVLPKAKKSVALSGTAAGNTAICTVGRTGNDLHYRGYDILILQRPVSLKRWRTLLFTVNCQTQLSLKATRSV